VKKQRSIPCIEGDAEGLTTFVNVHVVAGRSQTWAGCLQAISQWPILSHTCHAKTMPHPCHAMLGPGEVTFSALWSEHGRGLAWACHGMCESNIAALCKSIGKDTI